MTGRAAAAGSRAAIRIVAAAVARPVAPARAVRRLSARDAARARCSSTTGTFTLAGIVDGPDRPAPGPRVLEQPAARRCWSASAARCSASCSRSPRRAARLPRWLLTAIDAAVLLPLVSPPFTTAIAMIFSFGPRGLITYELLGLKGVTVYGLTSTLFSEILTYFPIAYLTLRPILAAIDSNVEGMALSLGASRWRVFRTVTLPLAHPGPRQRVPAAVRRVARRLRHAADPRRQPVPGAADAGLPADHRPVRPARRRGAVVRAAVAGARSCSCCSATG